MIESSNEQYYRMLIQEFEKDPALAAEYSVVSLQESIACLHPKGGLLIEIILFMIGWLSNRAIFLKPRL